LRPYPGVVHGFDDPSQDTFRRSEGHALLYDQAAVEDRFPARPGLSGAVACGGAFCWVTKGAG
jgi:hypothetical protein